MTWSLQSVRKGEFKKHIFIHIRTDINYQTNQYDSARFSLTRFCSTHWEKKTKFTKYRFCTFIQWTSKMKVSHVFSLQNIDYNLEFFCLASIQNLKLLLTNWWCSVLRRESLVRMTIQFYRLKFYLNHLFACKNEKFIHILSKCQNA